MEKKKWREKVTNEQVIYHIGERTLINTILRRKANLIGHILWRNCLFHDAIEGQMTGNERSRKKKNRAPRWYGKQEKILGAKEGSWRLKWGDTYEKLYLSDGRDSLFHTNKYGKKKEPWLGFEPNIQTNATVLHLWWDQILKRQVNFLIEKILLR